MTDRPHPGYYPDPSIPGFVRYWGGSAWVPGTSRPAPAPGEVLEPPRFVSRYVAQAPQVATARYVPPPAAPVETAAGLSDTGPVYFDQTSAGTSFAMAPGGMEAASELELRPRADMEAMGGMSAPWATVDGGLRPVVPQSWARAEAVGGAEELAAVPAQAVGEWPPAVDAGRRPVGELGAGPAPVEIPPEMPLEAPVQAPVQAPVEVRGEMQPAVAPVYEPPAEPRSEPSPQPLSLPSSQPQPAPSAGAASDSPAQPQASDSSAQPQASAWRADPREQRGLLETGTAPRWVSWGVVAAGPTGVEADPYPAGERAADVDAPDAAPAGPAPVEPLRPAEVAAPRPAGREAAEAAQATDAVAGKPVGAGAATAGKAAGSRTETKAEAGAAPAGAVAPGASAVKAGEAGPAAPQAPKAPQASRKSGAEAARPGAAGPGRSAATAARRGAAASRPAAGRGGKASAEGSRRAGGRGRVQREAPAAGVGRRVMAWVVDTAVVAVVGAAAGVPLVGSAMEHVRQKVELAQATAARTGRSVEVWLLDPVTAGKFGALLAVLLLFGAVYEVVPTARTGQTFGKRLARIRVVDASGTRPPTVGRSVARWLVRLLGTALLLGPLAALVDRASRRTWHDRAARTRVVARR